MVDATLNEVVSSIAVSAILEIYEIGGTVEKIFRKFYIKFGESFRKYVENLL